MNARGLRRYLDDLLSGRRPRPFQPNDFEADQVRTAIDLQAARMGADAPRQEFLTDLHSRLAAQMKDTPTSAPVTRIPAATRRQVMVGTSAAVAAVAVDRFVVRGDEPSASSTTADGGELMPNKGTWQPVTKSADISSDGVMHAFEVGSIVGFVRRVDGQPEAVSGVCTHQGCRLWFDKPDDRLRCPCHSTSFSPQGQVLAHQLSIPPIPLPKLKVRDNNGAIEVFAPVEPTQPT
jgi:nitrite reductase/ring-hydroxylating ferredoxin subunit